MKKLNKAKKLRSPKFRIWRKVEKFLDKLGDAIMGEYGYVGDGPYV